MKVEWNRSCPRRNIHLFLFTGIVWLLGCGAEPSSLGRTVQAGGVGLGEPILSGCARDPTVPPPISGGTLLVSSAGATTWVSDPDRDRVVVVDNGSQTVLRTVGVGVGAEPGRAVEGIAAQTVHVVLRSAGTVMTIDAIGTTRTVAVCPAPRGIARDVDDLLYVVCAGGEIVVLNADASLVVASGMNQPDLRDIVRVGSRLLVTTFRGARVWELNRTKLYWGAPGVRAQRWLAPPTFGEDRAYLFEPEASWRVVPFGTDRFYMAHQRALVAPVGNRHRGFSCDHCGSSVVHAALSRFDVIASASGTGVQLVPVGSAPIAPAVLPVDVAVASTGTRALLAVPGNHTKEQLISIDLAAYAATTGGAFAPAIPVQASGHVVAVSFLGTGIENYVFQTRQPSRLVYVTETGAGISVNAVELGGVNVDHPGHAFFHWLSYHFSGSTA